MTDLSIFIGKTVDDKYYFRLRNGSGKILLTSREYNNRDKCLNEIYGIQVYTNFEVVTEKVYNGYQYTLIGPWGRTVGESPVYKFSFAMQDDIKILHEHISKAKVIDNSSTVRFFRRVRI